MQPDALAAHADLGRAYIHLKLYEEAAQELSKAAASDERGEIHYQLSVALRKLGRTQGSRSRVGGIECDSAVPARTRTTTTVRSVIPVTAAENQCEFSGIRPWLLWRLPLISSGAISPIKEEMVTAVRIRRDDLFEFLRIASLGCCLCEIDSGPTQPWSGSGLRIPIARALSAYTSAPFSSPSCSQKCQPSSRSLEDPLGSGEEPFPGEGKSLVQTDTASSTALPTLGRLLPFQDPIS